MSLSSVPAVCELLGGIYPTTGKLLKYLKKGIERDEPTTFQGPAITPAAWLGSFNFDTIHLDLEKLELAALLIIL